MAEFKAGDVILAIGGAKVTGIPMFLEKMAEARAGDVLTLDVVRDGVRGKKRVTLKEMPREKGDGYDVIYGSVTSHGARLRTIVTRPKAEGRHPAVMLLQGGHTCFSIDNPVGQPFGFTWIARDLARHGYVTMRVERPGCGDSEGGPLPGRRLRYRTGWLQAGAAGAEAARLRGRRQRLSLRPQHGRDHGSAHGRRGAGSGDRRLRNGLGNLVRGRLRAAPPARIA